MVESEVNVAARRLADLAAGVVSTATAARWLQVAPTTLRLWERRFDFPLSVRSAQGRRGFATAQIEALREELLSARSISAAIVRARDRCEAECVGR